MSIKRIAPDELRIGDSFGAVFKGTPLQYKYGSLNVLHSEIKGELLRVLALESMSEQAVYSVVNLGELDHFAPVVVQRFFARSNFFGEFDSKDFEVDYPELFSRDLMSCDLDLELGASLFGVETSQERIDDYNNQVSLLVRTTFEYPGQNFERLRFHYHARKGFEIVKSKIVLLNK